MATAATHDSARDVAPGAENTSRTNALPPPRSLQIFTGWLACGWTEDHPEAWFAGDSLDVADGCYSATMPLRENRHLAYVYPQVPPARRRTGIGTALLRHAAARAADQGRVTLTAEVRDGSAGQAFAPGLGARRGEV